MQSKEKNIDIKQAKQIIVTPTNTTIDFNSAHIKSQLDDVKKEVKSVMEGANVDSKKLSLYFTI
jgi:hypothetical protein